MRKKVFAGEFIILYDSINMRYDYAKTIMAVTLFYYVFSC